MDSIIETQRATHEEIERYEQALAEILMQNPSMVSTCRSTVTDSSNATSRVEIAMQPSALHA